PTPVPTVVATMVPTAAPTAAATPAPPGASSGGIVIDVVHGVGSSTLIVKGKGFPPGREIVIRTTGPGVTDREVRATAGSDGSLDAKVGITRYGTYDVDAGGVKATFEVK
ncbi:MAG TPA: hypothetical protein VFN74_19495, partial [Chloroflexota bacterium]|nr:hypothetical protein [Chloroflexota bacterium]